METKITFHDKDGYIIATITEEGVNCCTGDIIWIGDADEDNFNISNQSFIITKTVYDFDNATRKLDARLYNGEL